MAGAPLGEIIYSSVIPMIRMYLIIGTGFFLTRKGFFGVTAARAFSDMVMMVFMPALVFDKIINYISIDDIKTIGVICFSAFIMYSINACFTILIVYFTPVPKTPKDRWVGGALLAGIMQNVSDLPISYIQAVTIFSLEQQNKGTAYVIIWLAMYVVVQFNCGLFKLVDWDFDFTEKNYLNKEKIDDGESGDSTYIHDDTEKHASNKQSPQINNISPEHNNTAVTDVYDNESPVSPTSSIIVNDDDVDIADIDEIPSDEDSMSYIGDGAGNKSISTAPGEGPIHSSKRHGNLNPVPLNLITSRTSHLSKILTNRTVASHASHVAISRIPSARNTNFQYNDIDGAGAAMDDESMRSSNDVVSLNQELIREYSNVQPFNKRMSHTMKIVTETNLIGKDVNEAGESIPFIRKYHLNFIVFFLQNFKKPNSIALVVSLTLALIPWTKALFVSTGTVHLPNAPNEEPPLNFITLYAEYLGYPCVPTGLLIIGSVLARLEVSQVPKGFWKSAVCHTTYRLGILPIIGMALAARFKKIGWLTDPMALFVCAMEYCLPSATVQIYLTAAAMRPGMRTCTPLNCIGMYMILQYSVLVIAMPITVCYCIKKVMGM
jgi:predicted permease